MTNWEKQKAYIQRRATALGVEMDAAISAFDMKRFEAAYQTSMYYMTKKQRLDYYKRFLIKGVESGIYV